MEKEMRLHITSCAGMTAMEAVVHISSMDTFALTDHNKWSVKFMNEIMGRFNYVSPQDIDEYQNKRWFDMAVRN